MYKRVRFVVVVVAVVAGGGDGGVVVVVVGCVYVCVLLLLLFGFVLFFGLFVVAFFPMIPCKYPMIMDESYAAQIFSQNKNSVS